MQVIVFGNPDLAFDSLPVKLLPVWQQEFPNLSFFYLDPNEELELSSDTVIIDTVAGIKEVKLFSTLDNFVLSPRVSLHDFDLLSQLKLIKKINPDLRIKIIGVPPDGEREEVGRQVASQLAILLEENVKRSSYKGRKI